MINFEYSLLNKGNFENIQMIAGAKIKSPKLFSRKQSTKHSDSFINFSYGDLSDDLDRASVDSSIDSDV